MKRLPKDIFLALLLVIIISACSIPSFSKRDSNKTLEIKKVAILPFVNLSSWRDADKIVANMFLTEMHKSDAFDVEELGNILQFIKEERIDTLGELDKERLGMLGERFGVGAILIGTVEEFDDGRARGAPEPVVSITARLVDPDNGRVIWSVRKKRRGNDYVVIFDFGKIRTVAALARKVVQEIIQDVQR